MAEQRHFGHESHALVRAEERVKKHRIHHLHDAVACEDVRPNNLEVVGIARVKRTNKLRAERVVALAVRLLGDVDAEVEDGRGGVDRRILPRRSL